MVVCERGSVYFTSYVWSGREECTCQVLMYFPSVCNLLYYRRTGATLEESESYIEQTFSFCSKFPLMKTFFSFCTRMVTTITINISFDPQKPAWRMVRLRFGNGKVSVSKELPAELFAAVKSQLQCKGPSPQLVTWVSTDLWSTKRPPQRCWTHSLARRSCSADVNVLQSANL